MDTIRILVAENDKDTADNTENSLVKWGYRVISVVADGKRAIEKARAEKPDIVLMDIGLEGDFGGIEVADAIYRETDIPVIFTTPILDRRIIGRTKSAMPFGYLIKPIHEAHLYAAIHTATFSTETLADSELKYRTLVETANEAIIVVKEDQFSFFNQRFIELTQYPAEELYAMSYLEPVHPDYREQLLNNFKKQLSGDRIDETVIYQLVTKNGDIKWVEAKPVAIDWEGSSAVMVFVRDTTERYLAEEAIRESEEKFRLISEQALMGIYIMQDDVFKFVNKTLAQYHGQPVEKLLGWDLERIYKTVHPDDLDLVKNQYLKKQNEDEGYATHYMYRDINHRGNVKWLECYSRNVRFEGKPAVLGAVLDVTEKVLSAAALRESEEKYRKVVENSLDAIFVIQKNVFKYYNAEAVKIFEYSRDELSELPTPDAVHPEDRKAVIRINRRLEQSKSVKEEYTHRIITKTGRTRWVNAKAVSITWDNRPAILVFLHDITEKKRSIEMLIQTEKMTSIGNLSAGMAHELNNPLGAILQSTQNIQRRLAPHPSANLKAAAKSDVDLNKLQSYLEERKITTSLEGIRKSGQQAAEIISRMLRFSRKSESKMAPMALDELIKNTLELADKDYDLKKRFDFRKIDIVKVYEPGMPLVPCIETEIQQVLLNLLNNAAGALFRVKRKTAVEPPRITIRLAKESAFARIEIEDNGPGIDPKIQRNIFEPFFTTKPEGEGTGLGLSVSYMIIVSNHQGTMEVESEINRGTRFIIRLPLSRDSGQTPLS